MLQMASLLVKVFLTIFSSFGYSFFKFGKFSPNNFPLLTGWVAFFFLRYKTPIHHVLLCYRWLLCQWQYSWYFFLCYRWFCFSILDQKFAITDWMICIEFFLSTTKHPYTLLLCYIWSLYHWIFPPIFSVLLFLLKCCPFSKKNFHYWLVDLQKKKNSQLQNTHLHCF